METFDNEDEGYDDVVQYLASLGGASLKEAVNRCFKEAFDDSLLCKYTWHGVQNEKHCLRDRTIIRAVYDAAISTFKYEQPSKKEIEGAILVALRMAHDRLRNRAERQGAAKKVVPRKSFWDEEGET